MSKIANIEEQGKKLMPTTVYFFPDNGEKFKESLESLTGNTRTAFAEIGEAIANRRRISKEDAMEISKKYKASLDIMEDGLRKRVNNGTLESSKTVVIATKKS